MIKHINAEFDTELRSLKDQILAMGGLVDAQVTEAVESLKARDIQRARAVIEADRAVNQMELAIDERCIRMLALRQPAASDLRFIAAALKMVTDLERIGDLAVNMAERVAEFAQAATNAVAAGFDGIELHGANGYLLEQFIRPTSNLRTDRYGGAIENRARFVLEVAEAAIVAIGKDKVGIRLSPFGVFNDMPAYPAMEADYAWLAGQLEARGLAYVHLVDHSPMGAPPVPDSIKATFRSVFRRALILSGGYDAARAERDLAAGRCDLVAVGRPFLANPDLVARWKAGAAVNEPDMGTFYTPGPKGYTDYPALAG